MHQLFVRSTVALLLSTASAFYPYDNRLPIHRIAVKRDNKYNVVSAAKPSQSDSAGVEQDGTDFTYFSSFTFGDSKQTFSMLIDSGASNTWVMSSNCKSGVCNAHNTFGSEDSSTLKVSDDTFGITYGTGSVEGVTGSDTAHFAGFSFPLTFGLGQNVSDEFMNYPMDGIVGLGRGDSTEPAIDAPTFMDALKSAGLIKDKLYGLNLWRAADGGTNNGEISFGSPDSSKYNGDLSYITAMDNTDGFWEIPIADGSVGGKSLGLSQRSALIDSGTSFILTPVDDAQKLHSQIEGSQQDGERYSVPCNWEGTVSLKLGDTTYDISYKDIVYKAPNGQCISNIIGRQTFGPDQWLVGDVFLKNVYTVFDFDGSRLGFGKKGASSDSEEDSSATSSASASAPAKTSATSASARPSTTVRANAKSSTTKIAVASSSTHSSSTYTKQTDSAEPSSSSSSDASATAASAEASPTDDSSSGGTTTGDDSPSGTQSGPEVATTNNGPKAKGSAVAGLVGLLAFAVLAMP